MTGSRSIMIVAVLMALVLSISSEKSQRLHARHLGGGVGGQGYGFNSWNGQHQSHQKPCTNFPEKHPNMPLCQATPTDSTAPSATEESTANTESTTDAAIDSSTSELTALQRAHWCRFDNGTYLPLGQAYMRGRCVMCRCTKTRAILCDMIQCMPTYCIDNKTPVRIGDQCCTQCSTDVAKRNSCEYEGVSYPHGAVMKTIEYKMQCWCQLGDIECRHYMGSLLSGFDIFGSSTILMVAIILFSVIFFGLLLCCGCSLFIYQYVQRNQHLIQQTYDEYAGTGGWQPITEEETEVVDTAVEEKHLEAEKSAFVNPVHVGDVPPPYAIHDNSYASKNQEK